MNSATQALTLAGAAGPIEALLDVPAAAPRGTTVIAHPHPLFGGTMTNKVVQTLARAFVQTGWRGANAARAWLVTKAPKEKPASASGPSGASCCTSASMSWASPRPSS